MKDCIERVVTLNEIHEDLVALGIKPATTVVVHSSLSALGFVLGGAPTVVQALCQCVGPKGTLAMPAATPFCADPANWTAPKLSQDILARARADLPLFDSRTTPTSLGAIPETFRNWPQTLRSDHPLESVSAHGPQAAAITHQHPLEFSEGPGSPFARLHELDASVLLVGVGFNRCTALHYAESLVPQRRTIKVRFPRLKAGTRVWVEVRNVADDNDTLFPAIGEEFIESGKTREGDVGVAQARLFRMQDLVTFARDYFQRVL